MPYYKDFVLDTQGDVIQGAIITVTDTLTASAATLYSNALRTVSISNNIATGSDGSFAFYVKPGRYTISVNASNFTNTTTVDLGATESVKDFGAVGNGSADDTAAIQAAITAVQGTSVALYFPPGTYLVSSTLNVTAALSIFGESRYGTSIKWLSTTLVVFNVLSQQQFTVESITFNGPTSGTAGAVIALSASSGENSFSIFRDCGFSQGFSHISTTKASTLTIDNCYFSEYVGIAVLIANTNNVDSGDSTITGCVFSSAQASAEAIKHLSSGGLRIVNNKILGGTLGYDMVLASGVATGVLVISGNSFENQTIAAIRMVTSGGGATYAGIVIGDNHISNVPTPILLNDSTALLSRMVITGNHILISTSGTVGVTVSNASDFYVGDNTITGSGGTGIGISIGSSCSSGFVGPGRFTTLTQNLDIGAVGVLGPLGYVISQSGLSVTAPADTNEDTLATVTVPANQMGKNGAVEVDASFVITNSANNKTFRVKFGGTNYKALVATSSDVCRLQCVVMNQNTTNAQVGSAPIAAADWGAQAGAMPTSAVDTTAAVTLLITGQKASAGESLILSRYSVRLVPGRT